MRHLSIAAILFICSVAACAQEKVLTESEFTETVSRAERAMYGGTHGPVRQTMETESTTEGRPETDYRLKSVAEIVPGQGSHRIEDRSFGGKPSRTETITLGDRSFTRDAAGSWKEMTAKPAADGAPAKSPATASERTDSQAEYKYLGTETYADRQVQTYLKTERKKTVNSATGATTESDVTAKVRIGTNGDYYRYESNSKNKFGDKTGSVKILIEVTADPTLKIAAPDVPAAVVKTSR